jgi:hypothetical protein
MAQTGGWKRPVIVYDLGGVLIDWNPRHLYRKLFDDETAMEWFLAEVCHAAWNEEQDRGRSFAAAIEEASARHPDQRPMIEAYFARWGEMVAGENRWRRRAPCRAQGRRLRAARADQLVGRDLPVRPRALCLPRLV